jgi:hypothetical protein
MFCQAADEAQFRKISEWHSTAFNCFFGIQKKTLQMHCITIVRVVPSVARAPAGQNSPLRGP